MDNEAQVQDYELFCSDNEIGASAQSPEPNVPPRDSLDIDPAGPGETQPNVQQGAESETQPEAAEQKSQLESQPINQAMGQAMDPPRNQPIPKNRKKTAVSAREKKQTALSGYKALQSSSKRREKARKNGKKPSSKLKADRKASRQKQKTRMVNLDSLVNSNIIQQAQANSSKASIPSFTAKDKKKALKELIDQIPNADKNAVRTDRAAILEAIKQFSKPPKSDGNNGWLFPDMKTSLYHYQLLGVDFMRRREKSEKPPYGGFICDDMGFGKTIQAIATILDGRPEPEDFAKTTLIVAPTHLVTNWVEEIEKHCKPGKLGYLRHHAGSRINGSNAAELMQNAGGVIVTTYSEVRSSMTDLDASASVVKESDKEAWFAANFHKCCGPLHRVEFRRIILDEAHEIKNYKSKTSIAVRMLMGKYRWVMSGTPVQNWSEQFYPFFDFLKIPHTGSHEQFLQTYFQEGGSKRSRLRNVLRFTMLRRTHAETLFGLPLLKLPEIEESSIEVRFSQSERFLYREIIKLFTKGILAMYESDTPELRESKNHFVKLLRLRMFTSHLLLPQKTLREVLTGNVMAALESLSTKPEDAAIYRALQMVTDPSQAAPASGNLAGPDQGVIPAPTAPEGPDLIGRFWVKLHTAHPDAKSLGDAAKCIICGRSDFDVFLTSCMHLYCPGCYPFMQTDGQVSPTCACGAPITEFVRCNLIESLSKHAASKGNKGPRASSSSQGGGDLGDDVGEDEMDWVDQVGYLAPGAKLRAVVSCLKHWFKESGDTKVILFTQFLGMTRLFSQMCEAEGWKFALITGKMPVASRELDISRFRDEPDVRVLISSLRVGGTGLNLTMANKCILVDLWWNTAVEQQAFCRLFRIGQLNRVQVVRVVVKNSIDDRLLRIQSAKCEDIEKTMGPDALSTRDTLDELLKIFGVEKDDEAEDGFRFLSDDEDENGTQEG